MKVYRYWVGYEARAEIIIRAESKDEADDQLDLVMDTRTIDSVDSFWVTDVKEREDGEG